MGATTSAGRASWRASRRRTRWPTRVCRWVSSVLCVHALGVRQPPGVVVGGGRCGVVVVSKTLVRARKCTTEGGRSTSEEAGRSNVCVCHVVRMGRGARRWRFGLCPGGCGSEPRAAIESPGFRKLVGKKASPTVSYRCSSVSSACERGGCRRRSVAHAGMVGVAVLGGAL